MVKVKVWLMLLLMLKVDVYTSDLRALRFLIYILVNILVSNNKTTLTLVSCSWGSILVLFQKYWNHPRISKRLKQDQSRPSKTKLFIIRSFSSFFRFFITNSLLRFLFLFLPPCVINVSVGSSHWLKVIVLSLQQLFTVSLILIICYLVIGNGLISMFTHFISFQ